MEWRVIELESHDAYLNMGIDEALLEGVRDGTSPPTIRFYTWKPSAVSIGRFQSMNDEVNTERCKSLGIGCVRRITGGGAVYHDQKGEITYSVIAPEKMFPKGIRESYREICGWVINGLATIGIDAEFAPINDILVKGKKISGNAQTRRNGVLLQHGTILYDLDIRTMFGVLNISREKISDKMIKSVEERVTRVLDYSNVTQEGLYSALLSGFVRGKDYKTGRLTETEEKRANELSELVYKSKDWNFSR